MNPSFELYRDVANEYRWRLRAANGAIIADSAEGYVDKRDARHGLDLVRAMRRDLDERERTCASPSSPTFLRAAPRP